MPSPEIPPHSEVLWLGASELARRIAAGMLSAVEVVEAHIQRIEEVNPQLNAVVVNCYARARQAALEIDQRRARGESLGPLAGVPVTIKECFHVAGTPSTIGLRRFAAELEPYDSPLVKRWTAAGAIVLGKTNVPQLMILHETDNPLYGRTNNPWNLDRSPGGSSGGEAAIVAAGGSPLGLASDLGGSIRQPAHSCGICGLLPTTGRIEVTGKRGNFAGMESLSLQPGPLARSVADLELGYRVLADAGGPSLESRIAPTHTTSPAAVNVVGLRIGIAASDGYFAAAPAIRRAVETAGQGLAAAGAHVEVFELPDLSAAMAIYFGLISADGSANLVRTLGSDKADPRIAQLLRYSRLRRPARRMLAALSRLTGQRRLAELLLVSGAMSADRYWQLISERNAYTERFVAALDAARLDAVVMPPHALPALTHGSTIHPPAAACYAMLANLLGMPAGVLPATHVAVAEESDRSSGRDVLDQAACQVERGSAGLPVGVQVLGRHWREDIVLAVMAALEAHFAGQGRGVGRPPL